MNHFSATQVAFLLEQVGDQKRRLTEIKALSGGGAIPSAGENSLFASLVHTSTQLCFGILFQDALGRIQRIKVPKSDGKDPQDISTMIASLGVIQESMYEEMNKRHFLTVAPDRVAYLEKLPDIFPFVNTYQHHLFWGNEDACKIRAAAKDVRDAGNCLAAECPTAAVFHAMRVAEFGLRDLAKKLKVKLTDDRKPQPIEFATWDKILTAINNELKAARSLTRDSKRQQKLAYYSDLADRCVYMKDLWRNEVMHSRRSFNRLEAAGILDRVREFIQLLKAKT